MKSVSDYYNELVIECGKILMGHTDAVLASRLAELLCRVDVLQNTLDTLAIHGCPRISEPDVAAADIPRRLRINTVLHPATMKIEQYVYNADTGERLACYTMDMGQHLRGYSFTPIPGIVRDQKIIDIQKERRQ